MFPAAGVPLDSPRISSLDPFGPIREVERSSSQLVWAVGNDSFARYIVHCVCRWHNIVSYSKSRTSVLELLMGIMNTIISGKAHTFEGGPRLTYLLRPHATRIANPGTHMFDTPPPTELDSASSVAFNSQDSDFAASESELDPFSEDDDAALERRMSLPPPEPSTGLQEPPLPQLQRISPDGDTHPDADTTPRPTTRNTHWGLSRTSGAIRASARSGSSPSRSPAARWRHPMLTSARTIPKDVPSFPPRKSTQNVKNLGTFWEYLYA